MPNLRSVGHFSAHILAKPAPVEGFHASTGCQPFRRATTLDALARLHRGHPATADSGAVIPRSCSSGMGQTPGLGGGLARE